MEKIKLSSTKTSNEYSQIRGIIYSSLCDLAATSANRATLVTDDIMNKLFEFEKEHRVVETSLGKITYHSNQLLCWRVTFLDKSYAEFSQLAAVRGYSKPLTDGDIERCVPLIRSPLVEG